MKNYAKAFVVLMAVLLLALPAAAQAPSSFLYQGRLTDADGDPITTNTSVVFEIYAASSGGSNIYTATHAVTPDENGIFTVQLININNTVFNGSVRYLQLTVAGNVLSPRQPITAAPYAYSSQYASVIADNSVNSAKITDNTVASADILNNSLADVDMLDEPGISRSITAGVTVPIDVTTCVDSASISVAASGYVLAIATGYTSLSASAGGSLGNIILAVEETSTTQPTGANYGVFGCNDEAVTVYTVRWGTIFTERLFTVASAGTYWYYLNAMRGYDGGTTSINATKLDLIYLPTSYGTTSALVTTGQASQFENADAILIDPSAVNPDAQAETVYRVDLRELELKAAKAEAEAEKAQKELMEARLKQQSPSEE